MGLEATAVVVPVLHRPHRAAPFMASLRDSLPERVEVLVHAVADLQDGETIGAWQAAGAIVDAVDPLARPPSHPWAGTERPGSFAEKANHGYRSSTLPWLLLTGDDVAFRPGWLAAAQLAAAPGFGVVGTNDLGNGAVIAGLHATHPLLRRAYLDAMGGGWDGPGVLCHEGYWHWYADDEIVEAAKRRGMWVAAPGAVVEHLHPCWGKAPADDVYRLGGERAAADGALFAARRARGWP
jgi:hypothetical protein